jgi:DNA-binding MarR family transcriptional regulator
MDTATISARQAAKALNTSTPRVLRALEDAGIALPTRRRARLSARQLEELRARLGSIPPVGELSRTETLVAAALARSPLGLASQRALARRAGVSPTAAGRAVGRLREQGLVCVEQRTLPGRRAHRASVIRADYGSSAWQRVAGDLARVSPPHSRSSPDRSPRVPAYLDYLFWNTADSQKDTRRAGGYIARRLLQAGDPEGLAWGAENLRPADWEDAAKTRGLEPAARSLAHNLARSTQ